MRELKRAKGNTGAFLLVRDSQDLTEYLVVSLWDSMKSIRAFAGDDENKPVYFPTDTRFLLGQEHTVKHYDVAAEV